MMKKLKCKTKVRIAFAWVLILSMLAGCGVKREAPALMEPLANNNSFRKVTRADVGLKTYKTGHVLPEEYPHFYERPTIIKELKVSVGDEVKEGDVLAEADSKALQEELTDLQASYNLLIAKHNAEAPLANLKQDMLLQQKQAAEYSGDQETVAGLQIEIEKEKENSSYDEKLYNYMLGHYQKEISEVEALIQDGTLKARKSGIVTYVKSLSEGNTVGIDEAVVVVGDYNKIHIEVDGVTLGDNTYKNYEQKVVILDGKNIPVKEHEFSDREVALARAKQAFPAVQYIPNENTNLQVGDTVEMCFIIHMTPNVLVIGSDSTNTDEGGVYVYVKGQDDSLEKRYVELGAVDEFNYEVKSGLEEGEEVYFVQESTKPAKYKEVTASCGNASSIRMGKGIHKARIKSQGYFSSENGSVKELPVEMGKEVKAGDVLAVIDTGGGSALIQDSNNQINHLTLDYNQAVSDFDKQIEEDKKRSAAMDAVIHGGPVGSDSFSSQEKGKSSLANVAPTATVSDATAGDASKSSRPKSSSDEEKVNIEALKCQKLALDDQVQITEIEKTVAGLEYQENLRQLNHKLEILKENNNGSGDISILAKEDSFVSRVYIKEGQLITGGESTLLINCNQEADDIIQIILSRESELPSLGQKIIISDGKGKEYTAHVCNYADNGRTYAFTIGDKVYTSSVIKTKTESNQIFAKVDDTSLFDQTDYNNFKFSIVDADFDKGILVPNTSVCSEEDKLSGNIRYFVWKVVDGKLEKHYVITGADLKLGSEGFMVILSGVSEGDVLAVEEK